MQYFIKIHHLLSSLQNGLTQDKKDNSCDQKKWRQQMEERQLLSLYFLLSFFFRISIFILLSLQMQLYMQYIFA
jgi:hypothetical protein